MVGTNPNHLCVTEYPTLSHCISITSKCIYFVKQHHVSTSSWTASKLFLAGQILQLIFLSNLLNSCTWLAVCFFFLLRFCGIELLPKHFQQPEHREAICWDWVLLSTLGACEYWVICVLKTLCDYSICQHRVWNVFRSLDIQIKGVGEIILPMVIFNLMWKKGFVWQCFCNRRTRYIAHCYAFHTERKFQHESLCSVQTSSMHERAFKNCFHEHIHVYILDYYENTHTYYI